MASQSAVRIRTAVSQKPDANDHMDTELNKIILILFYTSPVSAFCLVRGLRKRFWKTPIWLMASCVFTLLFGILLPITESSFTSYSGNLLFCDTCVFAYCCITVAIWHVSHIGVRAIVGSVALIPLAVLIYCVSLLADVLVQTNNYSNGLQRTDLSFGYICEYDANQIHLYHQWGVLPLIEQKVSEDYLRSPEALALPDCAEFLKQYQAQRVCQSDSKLCHG